jgi:glycosyltransferase involved in cell wall biosynthesis
MPPHNILLLLNQLPADPASGAARSMLTTAQMLAAAPDRFHVHALATSASESPTPIPLAHYFSQQNITPQESLFAGRRLFRYTHRNVHTTLLDVGPTSPLDAEKHHALTFNSLFEQTLRKQKIDTLLTFGGHPEAMQRRRIAKQHHCKIVFGLRNWGYLLPNAFTDCDAILTATQFVTDRYRQTLGIHSTPIPLAIDPQDVLAEKHERIFLTAINPTPEKGLLFLIRLLDELATRRPDIPALIIESRGNAGQLLAAAHHFNINLARHESLMLSPGVAQPKDIYAVTRLLLVPSLWEEPAGRVAVEAMLNGIPPLVPNRGGLPETVGSGGLILPIPPHITPHTQSLPTVDDITPWLETILQLTDDETLYQHHCNAARLAAARYHPDSIAPQLHAFFQNIR